jgi:hypothetical protein
MRLPRAVADATAPSMTRLASSKTIVARKPGTVHPSAERAYDTCRVARARGPAATYGCSWTHCSELSN